MRLRAAAVFLAAALLPAAAPAGSYVPPPGDASPSWSPLGDALAFQTMRSGPALETVAVSGHGERRLLERNLSSWAMSPDWSRLAWAELSPLHISRPDGSDDHTVDLKTAVGRFSWAPDSSRFAFVAGGVIYTVRADGSGLTRLVDGSEPAWSPDGATIAYVTTDQDIYGVSPGGGTERRIVGEPGIQMRPTWSIEGGQLAFLTQTGQGEPWTIGVVRPDGSGLRAYDAPLVINAYSLSWDQFGTALVAGTVRGVVLLRLPDGTASRLSSFGFAPVVDPSGRRVAFAGGGECRDRNGIYVMDIDGKHGRRLTNDCRIVGTDGPDTLRGTELADVLVGLGGDDRLFALDPAYVGDTLLGGPGDDVLSGGFRQDDLSGGPGEDKLYGGPSGDRLVGGPGRDRLSGQGGRDLIYAADGQRDRVICGTNLGRATPERDDAVVDRFDVVAPDCEYVNGRRR